MRPTISINVQTMPTQDCIAYPAGPSFTKNVSRHITQECDSYIDFIINGKNILNHYEDAYTYPSFQFLLNMNNGLVRMLTTGVHAIPIYLQQYSFANDSPRHWLDMLVDRSERQIVTLTFRWCESIDRPEAVPAVEGEKVVLADFVAEVVRNVRLYRDAVALLLLCDAFTDEPTSLFTDFADLDGAWREHQRM